MLNKIIPHLTLTTAIGRVTSDNWKNFINYVIKEDDKIMDETKVECSIQLNKQSLECNKVWKLY